MNEVTVREVKRIAEQRLGQSIPDQELMNL